MFLIKSFEFAGKHILDQSKIRKAPPELPTLLLIMNFERLYLIKFENFPNIDATVAFCLSYIFTFRIY